MAYGSGVGAVDDEGTDRERSNGVAGEDKSRDRPIESDAFTLVDDLEHAVAGEERHETHDPFGGEHGDQVLDDQPPDEHAGDRSRVLSGDEPDAQAQDASEHGESGCPHDRGGNGGRVASLDAAEHGTDGTGGEARQREHGGEPGSGRSLSGYKDAAPRLGCESLGDGVVLRFGGVDQDPADRGEHRGEHGGKAEHVGNGDHFVGDEARNQERSESTDKDSERGDHAGRANR